jgi:hypothetical protein
MEESRRNAGDMAKLLYTDAENTGLCGRRAVEYGAGIAQWYSAGVRGWMMGGGGSSPGRGWEFFSSPSRPDRLWGPPNLVSDGTRGSFPVGKAAGV